MPRKDFVTKTKEQVRDDLAAAWKAAFNKHLAKTSKGIPNSIDSLTSKEGRAAVDKATKLANKEVGYGESEVFALTDEIQKKKIKKRQKASHPFESAAKDLKKKMMGQ